MKMTRDTEESIRCTASTCSCVSFKPGSVQLRSCGSCGHGWVAHALEKFQLQARPPSSCGPVEVALPGLVFDLSSLVLYGAQAVPVRLKILLDRLYSVLTPEQVEHILHTLGWSLGDYVRGYMLQFPSGKVLDRWLMVTPEEELLILKQFLRFGETRPIVELMTLHCLESTTNFSNSEPKSGQVNISTFMERDAGTAGGFKTERGYASSGADVRRFKKNCPADCNETVQQFDNFPGRLSLLLPFHFPNSTFHLPTKELDPPSKVTFLWKPSNTKPTDRHNQEGEQEKYQIMKQPTIKIKADPDRPNLSRSVGHRKPWFQTDKDLDPQRSKSKQESTSSLSPSFISVSSPIAPSISSSPIKFTQKFQGSSSHSLSPLPSFSSSFLCSLPTSSFSSSLHPIPSTPPSLHPPPPSLCALPSLSPAGGRKGRVCCGVCGKSFYDKGTLKIHYNAVHLKIKHRCTVAGCTMVFSSLRSRNRHSANPNPRLHTGTSRDAYTNRNITNDPHPGTHSESLRNTCKNVHITPTQFCRTTEFSNNLWKHGNDEAHTLVLMDTLKNGSNSQINPQQDHTAPQACSPPPQPLSQTLSRESNNNNFPLSDSTNRSYPHTQALPPPPLLPVHVASSLGSHPSLIPLVSPAPGNTERCRSLLLHHKHKSPASFPDPTSITNQPASLDDGDPEEKRGKACTSPLTNEERWWDSGDLVPKKKPRKSSMPVKIEREKMREGRNKDEEDS